MCYFGTCLTHTRCHEIIFGLELHQFTNDGFPVVGVFFFAKFQQYLQPRTVNKPFCKSIKCLFGSEGCGSELRGRGQSCEWIINGMTWSKYLFSLSPLSEFLKISRPWPRTSRRNPNRPSRARTLELPPACCSYPSARAAPY